MSSAPRSIDEYLKRLREALLLAPFVVPLGVVIFTALMHAARGIGRTQVFLARSLLVKP